MPWLSISCEMAPAPAEAFSEALMEAGAESVALEPGGVHMRVTALAPRGADAAALVGLAARIARQDIPAFSVSELGDDDWVRRSQSQFGPVRISDALWIVPSWCEPPDPAALAVRLDPGLAFGTGSHATTRLVLVRLEELLRSGGASPMRVLDYGCGSGILAIVAAKLGARAIAAVDVDPQALEAASANARANAVTIDVAAPDSLAAGSYDLVLANILAGPLIALQPQLAARTRAGGRLLLSGILQSQAADVAVAYAGDFDVQVSAADEGWVRIEGTRK